MALGIVFALVVAKADGAPQREERKRRHCLARICTHVCRCIRLINAMAPPPHFPCPRMVGKPLSLHAT